MNCKKLISMLVGFLILLTISPAFAFQNENSKIDETFYNKVSILNKRVPVIVELNDEPSISYSIKSLSLNNSYSQKSFDINNIDELYRRELVQKQDIFISQLEKKGIDYKYKERCSIVLNAIMLDVLGSDLSALIKLPQVKMVYDDSIIYKPDRAIASETNGAKRVWQGTSTQKATGKGIIVGVIDTGLDIDHPEFSEKGKVKGGYDLADGDGDFSDADMHGTHVAGIIGGKGSKNYQRGMAYDANFMIYKVFSKKYQGASQGNTLAAIDRATADRCKVINLSLGSPGETNSKGSTAYHRAISNATKAGVIVVAAAGNDGARGKVQAWPAHAPGILDDSICVAASDDRDFQIINITSPKDKSKLIPGMRGPFTPPFDKSLSGLSLVYCNYGSKADFKEVNVKDKIALVMRGPKEKDKSVSFREKVDNAKDNGAKAVIIYNYNPGEIITPSIYGIGEDPNSVQLIPTVLISKEDGELLLSLIDNNLRLQFDESGGMSIADFSSMGPTADSCFKPEISAPGSSIYSTVPGGYSILGGTSMASPMIAGLSALIKEVHPEWNTNEVKSALMNTATIIKNPFNGKPITFLLQGAGEADVSKALNTKALIEPRALVMEKAATTTKDFTVKNITNNKINLPLSYEIFLNDGEPSPLSIELSATSLSINPGSTVRFTAKFNIDKDNLDRGKIEGIIKLDNLHIPFIILKDSVQKIDDQISNIKITPSELYFTEEKQTDNIEISFSLNYGVNYKYEDTNINLNYGNVRLKLVDENREEWAIIKILPNLLVGDYKINWNGKDENGKYILPEGKYNLMFTTEQISYNSGGGKETKEIKAGEKSMAVVESIVPEPMPLVVSTFREIAPKKEFNLDICLPRAEKVKGVMFNLEYNADKLILKRVYEGNFLYSDGSEVELVADVDDSKGSASIKALRTIEEGISGNSVKLLSIVFKPIDSGTLKFKLNSCFILLENNEKVKAKVIYPKTVKVNKTEDFLLSDINNDKKVDQYDLIMFTEAYGSKIGEDEYSEKCDFNQDTVVDINDLIIMSKEYGNSI